MLTADDIRGIAIFAGLEPEQCARIARAAADIVLQPGEYAAAEGAERALFAVLEGRIEPTKVVDGIERVLGERHASDIFGEVPITLGTVFPVGFRAAETSRVMRLEARDYHALAAGVPEVAEAVGRLASHRISGAAGLQRTAWTPPRPSCGASSSATRSRPVGSTPTLGMQPPTGEGRCRPRRTCPRFA